MIERLKKIRHVALDLDGTLYRGGTLFPYTKPFLSTLVELGIGYTFLTNNSSKSAKDYLKHLQGFGLTAQSQQLYTSGNATIDFLRRTRPNLQRLYLLGTPSLRAEFEEAGFILDEKHPELVVVGFDPKLIYSELCRAAYWISKGCAYVPTHPDVTCPTDDPTILIDVGSLCACLEKATGKRPLAIPGKPSPAMLEGPLERNGLVPEQMAMAGDRLNTDMELARRSGALGVLVLSGATSKEEAERAEYPPDVIVPSVKEFGDRLLKAQGG